MHEVKTLEEGTSTRAYSVSAMFLTTRDLSTLEEHIRLFEESLTLAPGVKRNSKQARINQLGALLPPALTWDEWESGEQKLAEYTARGQWPDGSAFGTVHTKPYLKAMYARLMQEGARQALTLPFALLVVARAHVWLVRLCLQV